MCLLYLSGCMQAQGDAERITQLQYLLQLSWRTSENLQNANFAFPKFSEVPVPASCIVLCRTSKLYPSIHKIQIIRTGCIMAPERMGAPDRGSTGLRPL